MRQSLFERALAETKGGHWVIAGHSRGAALAAEFARRFPERVSGLVLIGTTHPREFSLASARYPVTKILGSEDEVASPGNASAFRHLLPASARVVEIAGANHTQFGYYRWQLGAGTPRVSRERQQELLTKEVLEALKRSESYVEANRP